MEYWGVVLPHMTNTIFGAPYICGSCGLSHNYVAINDNTVISEFSYNYYIPNNKCAWTEDDRFCVLVSWNDFVSDPEKYIELAFNKRSMSIANKTKVRP